MPNKLYHVYQKNKPFLFDWLKKVATDTSISNKLKSVIATDPLISYRFVQSCRQSPVAVRSQFYPNSVENICHPVC